MLLRDHLSASECLKSQFCFSLECQTYTYICLYGGLCTYIITVQTKVTLALECLKLVSDNHIENITRGKASAQDIKGVNNFILLLKGVKNTQKPLERLLGN